MVSFDVESLFTNVSIEGAVKAAWCKLENDPGIADCTNLTPTQIADLLNFVLRSRISNITGRFTNRKREQPWGALSPRLLLTFTWKRWGTGDSNSDL